MRRWFVPLTLLGLGSLSVVLLSERGWKTMRTFFADMARARGLMEGNDDVQDELDHIQARLDGVAGSLGLRPEAGH